MARWTRALAALPFRTGRVLDLGCAFGFATRIAARRGYETVGVDSSSAYIARARRADRRATYVQSDAAQVPLPSASFDGLLCLDVLEHVPNERATLDEIARLLRPGGTLVLSVPHRGALWPLDSLNLYARFVRFTRHGRFPPEIAATGIHRHYSVERLSDLLGERFTVGTIARTGLGLAELVHLPLLVAFRWVLPLEPLYAVLAYIYYAAYLLEDVFPLGRFGYHLMIVARRTEESAEQSAEQSNVQANEAGGIRVAAEVTTTRTR